MAELNNMLPTVKNEFKTEPSVSTDSEDEDKSQHGENLTADDNKYFIVTIRKINFEAHLDRLLFTNARVILVYNKGKITLISSLDSSYRTTVGNVKCIGKYKDSLFLVGEENKILVVAFDSDAPLAYRDLYSLIVGEMEAGQNCTELVPTTYRREFQCILRVFFEGSLDINNVTPYDVLVIDKGLLYEAQNSALASGCV